MRSTRLRQNRTVLDRIGWSIVTTTLALAILLALAPAPASAHAGLDTSDPAPNAVVPTAPASVSMTFTEPLERGYSRAELYDQDGNQIEDTSVEAGDSDNAMVLVLPPELPNGTYTVLWRTLSTADGHTAQNYFAFTVGTEADVAATTGPEDTDAGPPLWLQAASRWIALLGLAAAISAWPMWLFVIRPSFAPAHRVARTATRRMRRYTSAAIAVALIGDIFAIAVQAASLTDGSLLDRIRSTLGDTRYGELWYVRVALLLALALTLQWVAWWWPRRSPAPAALALALSLAAAVPYSYIAHASALTEGRGAAIFADLLHILSASLWTGGVLALVIVVAPLAVGLDAPMRRIVLSRMLPRFSTVALVSWTTLILTGLYASWLHVGSLDALLDAGYGRALLVKLALLVPILLLAAFNLFIVTSRLHAIAEAPERVRTWTARFRLAIAAEALLAIAVLAAVGALTAQAPARESLASAPTTGIEVELTGGERDAHLAISPGTPGPNLLTLTVSGEPMLHETEVLVRVESSEQDTGQKDLRFVHADGTEYTYEGSELSLAGEWDLQLIVREPTGPEWRAYGTVDIGEQPQATTSKPSWVLSGAGAIAGMLIAVAGVAALVVSWQGGTRRRLPVATAGAAVLLLGAIVLLLARTDTESIIQLAIRIG
jgi:copper transport protein